MTAARPVRLEALEPDRNGTVVTARWRVWEEERVLGEVTRMWTRTSGQKWFAYDARGDRVGIRFATRQLAVAGLQYGLREEFGERVIDLPEGVKL